jgi:hypothetical protein
MRPSLPRLAAFMDDAEEDVLAYMDFPPLPPRLPWFPRQGSVLLVSGIAAARDASD